MTPSPVLATPLTLLWPAVHGNDSHSGGPLQSPLLLLKSITDSVENKLGSLGCLR